MKELISYLKLTQEELKKQLYFSLVEKGMNPMFEDGFIYAKGDMPVLLVAHLDTVGKKPPVNVSYFEKCDMIYNPDGILGGDDRCGVYAIMKLLEHFRPYVLFTEDEEIGGIGARKAVNKLAIPAVKYIIEFDRRGKDDCVFYDCGNKQFMEYIEKFGFKKNYGSFSDISILGSDWDIAAVNLSSGYYREHTANEYIIFGQLLDTIGCAKKMLKNLRKAPYFDYQEVECDYFYCYPDGLDETTMRLLAHNYLLKEDDYKPKDKRLTYEKNDTFPFGWWRK